MKNIVYYQMAPFKIVPYFEELSKPMGNYVTIKLLYCGICGSDYSYYLGRRKQYPISLGHELVGKIIEIGNNVKNFNCGEYIVTDFNYRCNECEYCLNNKTHLCNKNNAGLMSNRGFAYYTNIHKNYLFSIVDIANLKRGTLIEPLSCVIHGIKRLNIDKDIPILICGGGSIGMLMCFYLKIVLNHTQIYIKESNTSKLNKLLKHFKLNILNNENIESFNIVIECTNSIDGMLYAMDSIKKGGNMCIMSHLYGLESSFIYETLCKKEINAVFPLRNGNTDNIYLAIQAIKKFWVDEYDDMIQVYKNIHNAFEEKQNSNYNKQIISFV